MLGLFMIGIFPATLFICGLVTVMVEVAFAFLDKKLEKRRLTYLSTLPIKDRLQGVHQSGGPCGYGILRSDPVTNKLYEVDYSGNIIKEIKTKSIDQLIEELNRSIKEERDFDI